MPKRALAPTLLAALALTGCTQPAAPSEGPDVLRTELAVLPAVLTSADTAEVVITVRNPTSRPVEFRSSCRGPTFRVFQGELAVAALSCPIPEAEPIRLAPGQQVSSRQRFAVLQSLGGGRVEPLPPGEYGFVGGWDVGDSLRAQSPPVTVRIQP